jgi:outer membrane protein assembly factor BamB
MELKGDLSSVSLVNIFQGIISEGKEGTLIIYDDKSKKEIYFSKDGIRLLSSGERKGLAIGELLVNRKIITPAQLSQALTTQKTTSLKLGEILCHMKVITPQRIDEIIKEQIEDEICDVFRWENARFEFTGPPPTKSLMSEQNPVTVLSLDVNHLLKKISQRSQDWESVKGLFKGYHSIIRLSDNYEEKLEAIQLSEDERVIFSLMEGFKTLDDIVKSSPLGAIGTYKAVYNLSQKGIVCEIGLNEIKDYARQLRKEKNLTGALLFYQQALSINPQDLGILENVAEILEKSERFTEAGEKYKQLAKLLTDKSDINLAITYYKKSLSFLPADEEIYNILFNLWLIQNQKSEAIKTGKELLKLYAQSKKIKELLELVDKISSIQTPGGTDVELRAYVVSAYFQMGEYNKSREELDKIIKDIPQSKIDLLIKTYESVLKIEPRQSDVRYRLDDLRKTKLQQRKRTRKRLAITGGIIFVLLIVALIGWNDYATYKRFELLKQEVDNFKKKEDYESAISKYQQFKFTLAFYTRSALQKEINSLHLLSQKREDKINAIFNKELISLQERYKNIQVIKEKQNYDNGLKEIIEIEPIVISAIDNLPNRIHLLGGSDTIIENHLQNYQQFLEEIRRDRLATEKYLESASSLHQKSKELTQMGKLEESARVIRELVSAYPASHMAQTARIPIYVETIPSGADVFLNNVKQGKTSLILYLSLKETSVINLKKRGFSSFTKEIKSYEDPFLRISLEKAFKWQFNTNLPLETTPLIYNDMVFITTKDGYLKAIDSHNGSLKWVFKTDTPSEIYSSPQINNNMIIFGATDNNLYAVRSNAPIKLFQVKTNAPIRASAFFSQDRKITLINNTDKNLYAISENSAVLWKYNAKAKISAGGVVDNMIVYITSEDGLLHALDLTNGEKIWALSLGEKLTPPIIDKRMLYAGSTNKTIYAVNLASRAIQWSYQLKHEITAHLSLADDSLLVPCNDGILHCFDINTQKIRWHFNTKGPLSAGAIVSRKDNVVYFGSEDTYFYAITLSNGQEIWKYKTNNKIRAIPSMDDTTVYIGSDDGFLHAIEK